MKTSLKKVWANAHKILEAVVEAVFEILKSQNICYLQFVFKIGVP